MRGHLDIGHQGAVDAKANAGFLLTRHRLDVNIRRFLVIGVDDHFVDELDQFIVGRRRFQGVVVDEILDR